MKKVKKIAYKIAWILFKVFMPKKYHNRYFVTEFFQSKYLKKISLFSSIKLFFSGFLPEEYFGYQLEKNNPKDYLPALVNYQNANLNGGYNYILGNKVLFVPFIKSVISGIPKLNVIENIAYINDESLHSLCQTNSLSGFESLFNILEENELILKPISGAKGKGILLLKKNAEGYLLGNTFFRKADLVKELKKLDNYLIQEKLIQVGFANKIFPPSLNTMRIMTMKEPNKNTFFIPYAFQRFSTKKSGAVDHMMQGGISAFIDVNTGKLSHGISLSPGGKIILHEFHPDTGEKIYNEKIPEWSLIKDKLNRLATRMPYFKYVGWDVALSGDDVFIIEGNNGPGGFSVQLHKPLKEIPEAWSFYEKSRFFN